MAPDLTAHDRRKACAARAVAAMLAISPLAAAHDTWLLPAPALPPADTATVIELTSGMGFPVADYAVHADRIVASGCRAESGACTLTPSTRSAHALAIAATDAAPAAVVWIDLASKTLTLSAAKVAEYLDEIDASPDIRATWAAMPAPKQWRETYRKHAKAMIGDVASIASWSAAPTSQTLEIVAMAGGALRVGGSATFALRKNGQPLAGLAIGVLGSADPKPQSLHTDSAGQIKVKFDHAGPWLLRVTDLQAPARDGDTWHSDFATLTLRVR